MFLSARTAAIALGLFAALTLGPFTANAQQLPGRDPASLKPYTLAKEAGQVAGHAIYCKADADAIESYIIRVEARIAALAKDDFAKIDARIQFKNVRDAKAGSAPEMGCKRFILEFEEALKQQNKPKAS